MDDALFGGTAAKREAGRDKLAAAAVAAAPAAAAVAAAAAGPGGVGGALRGAGRLCASSPAGSGVRSDEDRGLAAKRSSEVTSTSSGTATGGGAEGATLRRLGLERTWCRSLRSAVRSSSPKADEIGGVSNSGADGPRAATTGSAAGGAALASGGLAAVALLACGACSNGPHTFSSS